MLTQQILSAIAEKPRIRVKEIRRILPNVDRVAIRNRLEKLREEGLISMVAHGVYELPQQPKSLAPSAHQDTGFIQPPSRARLMARR